MARRPTTSPRRRADRLLVELGLFESRARAQAAIAAGLVTADGAVVRKASEEISAAAALHAQAAHPWVSRGGVKLSAVLEHFRWNVSGRICLDVGASTGGFTDVLITRGAARVYAVDVGSGQLHPRLLGHRKIVSLEKTDIRRLDPALLPDRPDFAVVDVSFISLKLVLPAVAKLLAQRAQLIVLVKPQFETQRRHIKKGVVRDEATQAAVCDDISASLISLGWRVAGTIPSPILGGDGNREFLIGAQRD
jgi:23S rRNA (cytidine1920-2'-O)/16S rRNA (cytidine1409-2'-O)-methyltransferase